jgi:signal transduction histidine kinase
MQKKQTGAGQPHSLRIHSFENDDHAQESPATMPATPAGDIDLETVLGAWYDATEKLQLTHEMLRQEVARLSDELEAKNRVLERQNRLADLGQMASHVAHEVRNGLAPITLYLSLLRRQLAAAGFNMDLTDKIDSAFTAVESTVSDLLHFASHREPNCHHLNVRHLVSSVLDALAPQMEAQQIEIDLDIPFAVSISADEHMVRRAILNLVLNALDAMPNGGELVFTAIESELGVELEIADSGPGIPDTVLGSLFEPFFTTKSTGTGLGLAIVGRILDVHGGNITVTNCPEGGVAFSLTFPYEAETQSSSRGLEAAA